MKHLVTILIFQLIIFSCTKIIENTDSYNYFDIMTWNIEEFPKHTNTNALVTSSILKYNPSVTKTKYFEKIRLQHRPNSSNIKIGIIKTNAIAKTYTQETQRSN